MPAHEGRHMAGAPQRDDLTRYRRLPALGDGGSFMSSSITQKICPVCNYVRKGVVCAPGPRALRRGTKRKKRGLRPEKSGGSPACGVSLGILPWTSTVKPFFESSVQRDADPHGYKEKRVDIYFVNPSWQITLTVIQIPPTALRSSLSQVLFNLSRSISTISLSSQSMAQQILTRTWSCFHVAVNLICYLSQHIP